MLVSRDLDDQRFEEIVREAEGRLPWLCPPWTDHNAHDPGITILELMAWYKETQQYEINRVSPEIRRKLLELAGTFLGREQAAVCALEIPPEAPPRPLLSSLETPEGVVFELEEEIPRDRAVLERVLIRRSGERESGDITDMVSGGSVFQPFAFGGRRGSALMLDFSHKPEKALRLWFDVQVPEGVQRNAPDEDTEDPRGLTWELSGAGKVEPLLDETLALSRSGYVTLPVPAAWQADGEGLYRLTLRQTDPGCEEEVRLKGISAGRYLAVQTESRARAYRFVVKPKKSCRVDIGSAQAGKGEAAVFLRAPEGWKQISEYRLQRETGGLHITLDASDASDDGGENLFVASLDPIYLRDMLFDAAGRPGESFRLNLGGKRVLTEHLTLVCQTLCEDGEIRPALWCCVDDLSLYGPRDRVFTYDRDRETLTVGDGAHGALIAPGKGAVLIAEERLSLCGGGNIPANAGLFFTEDGMTVGNTAAMGGCEAESLAEGRGRLLRRLEDTRKCVSARDYERQALRTPGLRVAGARALPGYNVRQKHQKTPAWVSVAVLPAGDGDMPMPDRRFLAAVSRQLERSRTICIRTEAIPVRYADFSLSLLLRCEQSFRQETAEDAIRRFFAPRSERIGAGVLRDDLAAVLQKLPGVLQVDRVEFRGMDQNSYQTSAGDLTVMPDTILHLKNAAVSLAKDRR
ncbi:MAG: baseplate J/gp47 family protein [Oscillospiraceae bacterium]|nr:baseplate J/gp47 family protein [Oscillospiraceae bacterium]